jgi:hypothetical protein
MCDENETTKKIAIVGTNNRYHIKKLTTEVEHNKERAFSKKNNLSQKGFNYEYMMEIVCELNDYLNKDLSCNNTNGDLLLTKRQIETKINGYKQQDILKNIFDANSFIDINIIVLKLFECKCKCHYCSCEIIVVYKYVREHKQWSVDRIDNNYGHNKNNIVISCLECNLNRRCKPESSFLFTKQLIIIKQGNTN